MLKESHMFALLICLCSCSFSDHVLAATTASERMSSVNTEKTLANPPNAYLIQQAMEKFLFLLKKCLTYKALLIVIFIATIYIWYKNDDTSLQQEPSKTHRKSSPNQQQKKRSTGSFGSSYISEERNQSDSQKEVEGRQGQMIQSKRPETPHQQKPLNVSKERSPKKSCLNQKRLIPQSLLERPKKKKKSDDERPNIRTEFSSVQYIKDGQRPGNEWDSISYGSESFWVYRPSSQQRTEGEHPSSSRMIVLKNSFIPHPNHHILWANPKFYTESDMKTLATTSIYAYIQSKKLSDMRKKGPNSYMLHPAYKTFVIFMALRVDLIETGPIQMNCFNTMINRFEFLYAILFDEARKKGYISYEFFRKLSSSYYDWWAMTPLSFLTRKFFEKRQWTLEDLKSSKNVLKEELEQAIKEWINTPNYSFIPEIHKVDPNLYGKSLKRMQSLRIPFCNCPKISQLFVSSRDGPLKLFLFWDIFNALRMQILAWDLLSYDEQYSLRGRYYVDHLISWITDVYSNQDEEYLKDLYFELVDFIQQGFFGDGQLYKSSQTREQRRDAFDDYMLGIQGDVQTFLEEEVFIEPPVAIRV